MKRFRNPTPTSWRPAGCSTWATWATQPVIPRRSAIGFKDNLVVALGGVNEVAITPRPGGPVRRMAVGRHPVALASSTDGKTIYVANRLDDTISVIESRRARPAGDNLAWPRG